MLLRRPRHWLGWLALLLVAALVIGQVRPASGAIVAGTPAGAGGSGISSLSWSHTTPAGAGGLLVVRVANLDSSVAVSSIAYGGVALTPLASAVESSITTAPRASIYYLLAPAPGTATVTLTLSASSRVVASSIGFTGVSQSSPFGTAVSSSGNSTTPSVTMTGSSGQLFIDAVAMLGAAGSSATAGSGQAAYTSNTGSTAADVLGLFSTKSGTASSSLGWTAAASTPWVGIGVPLKAAGPAISGTVFEDANYGGGAGRSQADSNGIGVGGATVELYDSTGTYVRSTAAGAGGSYNFTDLAPGTWYVRVASATMASARSGNTGALLGVLVYRTDAGSGSAVAVTNHVGGVKPSAPDPGTAGSGTVLNIGTGAYSAGLSGTAQAITPVTVASTDVGGIDFGFNFDTVVNTNDSGQGSLRQAIANANLLGGDSGLVQVGLVKAMENLVFMMPNGSSAAGLRSTLNAFTTAAGSYMVATVALASSLPTVTAPLVIDAQTQPGWAGKPIIELNGSGVGGGGYGLIVTGGHSTVRGLIIDRFSYGVWLATAGSNTVQGCWVGTSVAGNSASANIYGIYINGTSSNLIGGSAAYQGNVISGNSGSGMVVWIGSSSNVIQGNYVGLNAAGSAAVPNADSGVIIFGSNTVVGGINAGEGNVVAGNGANAGGASAAVSLNGTGSVIRGNLLGTNAGGTATIASGGYGVYAGASNTTVGGTAAGAGNTITGFALAGVGVVGNSVSGVAIEGNSIYGNTGIGIDLNGDGVTPNTGSVNGGQPNLGMNKPVITAAGLDSSATGLTVYGYVGTATSQAPFAGARVAFFKALADASGAGQGQVFLGALTADSGGRFGGTLGFAAGLLSVGDPLTATATDPSGNSSEFAVNWVTTSVEALTPAGFNAFETSTGAGALTGVIQSSTASAATSLDVIALNHSGTGLHPGFTGSVSLVWLDARNDTGAISGSCRSSWISLGSAGCAVFSNSSRITVGMTPPASGTRSMRLMMSYTGVAGTTVACSNDAFADLPAQLAWINASDADSASPGTLRVLANIGASGGVVHRAGQPFTLRAQALDAAGALMTGYDGSPVLATSGCLLPAGCAAAALSSTTSSASAGLYRNSNVSYADVGVVQLQLVDSSYAAVDGADTPLASRTFGSSLLAVGRFVPDTLTATLSAAGVLSTANATCLASGQGATFLGQGFGWASAPQLIVSARNAAGGITALWTGALMKLTAGGGSSAALAVSDAGSASLSVSYGALSVMDLGGGQARLAASGSDRFLLDVAAGQAQASTSPTWAWTVSVVDASEAAVSGNPSVYATASQTGVGFNQGAVFHSGRLALAPGNGDVRAPLKLAVQLQRRTSAGWVTMTEDRGCVTVQPANLGAEAPSGVFSTLGACAAPMQAAVTTAGGRAWITLPGTPGGAPGGLMLRLAGPASTGMSCTPAGAIAALVPLTPWWLLGGTSGTGSAAQATWGKAKRDAVLRREVW